MKKRILSIALTVALLITLIPTGAVTARAESEFTISPEMVEVIKKWEGFNCKPYWDYQQWTVGYGTRVPDGKLNEYMTNGIPEEEATQLLTEMLNTMGKSVNSFLDKFCLTVNQAQFDALVSLTFNVGNAWLFKPGTLRTAIVEGWTGDDLVHAMSLWSNAGSTTLPALVRRRLAETETYLNGVYSATPPAHFGYVQFDGNGGESDLRVQGFDVAAEPAIRAVATYEDYTFEGWYTDPTGGEKITHLDASLKGYTLYAHWSAGSDGEVPDTTPEEIVGTAVNYEKQVATGVLHSFQQPVEGALVVDAYTNGELVKIVAEYTDAAGITWGQLEKGAWINLAYTQDYREPEDEEGPGVRVTVTGDGVNVRRGPSTSFAVVAKANSGDVLEVTATQRGAGYLWGKTELGWIALKYTDYDAVVNGTKPPQEDPTEPTEPEETEPTEPEETEPTEPEETEPTEPEVTEPAEPEEPKDTVVATGTVRLQSGVLNVRSGPSTGYGIVGSVPNGQRLEFFELKTAGSMEWGRTASGWVSMSYVLLDKTQEPGTQEPEPQEPEVTAVTGKVTLTSGRLNLRSGPGTGYTVVGWLNAGDTVVITEQKLTNGTFWGKTDRGWVSMNYITLKTENADQEGNKPVLGIVQTTGGLLRARTGPGTSYPIAGYIANGSQIEIFEQQVVAGVTWGRTEKGWVCFELVKLKDADTGKQPDAGEKVGTVITNGLRIRTGAGTDYRIVGRLYNGEKVTVLETKEVDGTTWGRIANGWISLDYVEF